MKNGSLAFEATAKRLDWRLSSRLLHAKKRFHFGWFCALFYKSTEWNEVSEQWAMRNGEVVEKERRADLFHLWTGVESKVVANKLRSEMCASDSDLLIFAIKLSTHSNCPPLNGLHLSSEWISNWRRINVNLARRNEWPSSITDKKIKTFTSSAISLHDLSLVSGEHFYCRFAHDLNIERSLLSSGIIDDARWAIKVALNEKRTIKKMGSAIGVDCVSARFELINVESFTIHKKKTLSTIIGLLI